MRQGQVTRRSAVFIVGVIVGGIFVAGGAWLGMHPLKHGDALQETREAPFVSLKQLVRMPEYKHACRGERDCPSPLSCLEDFRYDAVLCMASECVSDLQCPRDEVCQPVPTLGPWVRLCLPRGTLEEGARCSFFPLKGYEGCKPGLFCNFGRCALPCRSDVPSECPPGTFCREDLGQRSCAPTCLETGCPAGQACVRTWDSDNRLSLCVKVIGSSCLETPCPRGEECYKQPGQSLETLTAWCMATCDVNKPCANGDTCYEGHCRHRCRKGVPSDCPPEQQCLPFPDGGNLCTRISP